MRGRVLATRRRAVGLKQSEVAERVTALLPVGRVVTQGLLSQIETERLPMPRGWSVFIGRAIDGLASERADGN
jgi:transcriptional regulator with XRE-family HTH domain